jgi:hypothetical protein
MREAGIHKHVTPHTFRHSYATGLLEAGVDLLTISRLLGHRSFSSTLVYLHVRRPHLESVPSPLDWLPVEQCPKSAEPATHQPTQSPSTDTNCSSEAGSPQVPPTKDQAHRGTRRPGNHPPRSNKPTSNNRKRRKRGS